MLPGLFILFGILYSTTAKALPLGYGYNQGDLKFDEIKDDNFIVYFDSRTPHDASTALTALNAAKPHLERWFQVKRSSRLIVNMSAESDNASFANFFTDSIELQTLGSGSRDLAWHEFTHSMMYRHLDNWFGPAGAIVHLPWMEAWYLEGLAEAMSVSVGSKVQASNERYQALTGDWPSWDRIHSLYTSGPFTLRGYATSGAFVSYLIRTYSASKMIDALQKFRDNTLPWWWPWAFTPFNNFWPMDTMMVDWTGKKGRELYEEYKAAATRHWTDQKKSKLDLKELDSYPKFRALPQLMASNGDLLVPAKDDNDLVLKHLQTTDQGKPQWSEKLEKISDYETVASTYSDQDGNQTASITEFYPKANHKHYKIQVLTKANNSAVKRSSIARKVQWVSHLAFSKSNLWWQESNLERTKICFAPRAEFRSDRVQCIKSAVHPAQVSILGFEQKANLVANVWILESRASLSGDTYRVHIVHADTGKSRTITPTGGGRPEGFAKSLLGNWILMADKSRNHLQRIDDAGKCIESFSIDDMAIKIVQSQAQKPWLISLHKDEYVARIPHDLNPEACQPLSQHTSPLLVAVQLKRDISIDEAMQKSNLWQNNDSLETFHQLSTNQMDTTDDAARTTEKARPAKWRGRPIFLFPWIGADDALGPQLGIVSVPLMDQLQNETLRATIMVGIYSRFPYQELSLVQTRFTPTWSYSLFRSQTYNGKFRNSKTLETETSYLDEKGGHIDGSLQYEWSKFNLGLSWGARSGHLAPYIGPAVHYGSYNELYSGVTAVFKFANRWSNAWYLQGKAVPKAINENFDYDQAGAGVAMKRSINNGFLEAGIDGSRTRGNYRRDIQEMYTPLKTFLPGSGGGYNRNSYALTADQGLFSPVFGDTQGRFRFNASHPLISDIDKFMGLVYVDRLDFSGFFNHGGAWNSDKFPGLSSLISAQGYNIDLQMDNKGVHFNMGTGVGQVLGAPWQLYATAGFDAFF
jgi:hypothetical protein